MPFNSLNVQEITSPKISSREIYLGNAGYEEDQGDDGKITILNNLGNFEDYMGYKNKAISFYKQAFISSDSSYYNAIYNLGRIYCKLGEYQESERILNYILDNFDEPEHQSGSSHLLATVYVQLKDCEKAKIYYLMSKKMFDSVPELKTLSQELAEEIMACEDGKID